MSLLLPHGLRKQQVSEISLEDMAWLATAEDVLRKLEMSIYCKRCKAEMWGKNDETDATLEVVCECRRLRYRARAERPM